MALVIITGLPCSGRTTRARELQANFQRRIAEASSSSAGSSTGSTSAPAQAPAASTSAFKSRANAGGNAAPAPLPKVVSIVNDADIHVDRETYASQAREKPARASYLSAAMRALSQDRIVLADAGAGTYIKGFRYQLWCAARESGVRCVTIHVAAPPDLCREWNTARAERSEDAYTSETLEGLLMRFEEPNAMTRWDSPLFIIPSGGDPPEPAPLDEIWAACTTGAPKKANMATVPHNPTTSNYLTMLETGSQALLSAILSQASDSMGGRMTVSLDSLPGSAGPQQVSLGLPPDKALTLSALQRHKRQFVRLHSAGKHAGSDVGRLGDTDTELDVARRFAHYLETSL